MIARPKTRSQRWARTDIVQLLVHAQAHCMPVKKYAVTQQLESGSHDSGVAFQPTPSRSRHSCGFSHADFAGIKLAPRTVRPEWREPGDTGRRRGLPASRRRKPRSRLPRESFERQSGGIVPGTVRAQSAIAGPKTSATINGKRGGKLTLGWGLWPTQSRLRRIIGGGM